MEKMVGKQKFWIIVCLVSCIFNFSCKNPNACSQTSDEENKGITQKKCGMDTLESGVMCTSIGSYTVLDYTYVSPSTAKRYAYDFYGRKVFEEGFTYSDSYSFAVWEYDEDGRLKAVYRSDDFEPSVHEAPDKDDELSNLVYTLTDFTLSDPAIEKYIFDYHPAGHIRRVYDPDNKHEITCSDGGEITFRVYPMDADDSSKLTGNNALNIEFHVRENKDGVWKETLYLGYEQIAQMEYKD